MTNKQQPPQKSHPLLRIIGIILLSIFIIIGLITIGVTYEKHQTKKYVMSASNELKLPENFMLTGTRYSDHSCLDVCANVTLYYKSKNGQPLDRQLVVDELKKIGYQNQEYYPDEMRKSFNEEGTIKVRQLNAPPENLTLNFSR